MTSRYCGMRVEALLLMWTMCSGAPVFFDASRTSWMLANPDGSEVRMWTWQLALCFGRHTKYLDNLLGRRSGRIGKAEADSGRSFRKPAANEMLELFELPGIEGLQERFALKAGVAAQHGEVARVGMADARSEVDGRLPLALAVPDGDILDADLELQGRRDAVVNLRLVVVRTVSVLMQVDETPAPRPARSHRAL